MIYDLFLLIVFIACTGWVGYALWHALKTGEMYGRPVNVYRSERPINFWISFSIGLIGFLMMLLITVAMMAVAFGKM